MVDEAPPTGGFDMLRWTCAATAAAFLKAAALRSVPAGQIIYQQGDPGLEMFRIVSGSVRLSVSWEDGREIVFLYFNDGDCFGVSSLIDGAARPQTALALSDTRLQVVDSRHFAALREDHKDFDDALLKLMSHQMRTLSAHFIESSLLDLAGRIGGRLIEYSRVTNDRVEVSISQTELAALVGASRQGVNRVLQHLQARGLITLHYNLIQINDLTELRNLVSKSH